MTAKTKKQDESEKSTLVRMRSLDGQRTYEFDIPIRTQKFMKNQNRMKKSELSYSLVHHTLVTTLFTAGALMMCEHQVAKEAANPAYSYDFQNEAIDTLGGYALLYIGVKGVSSLPSIITYKGVDLWTHFYEFCGEVRTATKSYFGQDPNKLKL